MFNALKKNISILIVATSLTSCSNNAQENIETEKISASEEYFVELENYGRNITLLEKPTKVLTLGPNCTEMFVALGLGDYVTGRSLVNHSRGPLEQFADEVNAIPYLNYAEATREGILTSGANFIYAIDWEISDIGCNIEEAEEYGMNVYVNSATSLDELFKEIDDLGKIFGVEERATEFITEQKTRLSAVKDRLQGVEPVKVLVYDSGSAGVFTCSGSNFESVLIELAGGVNIFNDITDKQWVTVSYEDIIKRNPDVIVIHDYDNISYEEKKAEIKANPVLTELDCVKNERFVYTDLESVLPGNRVALTVESLAKGFHPDVIVD